MATGIQKAFLCKISGKLTKERDTEISKVPLYSRINNEFSLPKVSTTLANVPLRQKFSNCLSSWYLQCLKFFMAPLGLKKYVLVPFTLKQLCTNNKYGLKCSVHLKIYILKYFYFNLKQPQLLLMEWVCLLDIKQLFKPWNQIGHNIPNFLFNTDFLCIACFLSQ